VATVVRARIEDTEDVVSDTLTHLLYRLRDAKNDTSCPIHDLRGYIAIVGHAREKPTKENADICVFVVE